MRPRLPLHYLLPSVFVPAALVLAASGAMAASIAVTATGDRLYTGDGCSLREAVINANTDSQAGSSECVAGSGADTILLPSAAIGIGSAGSFLIADDAAAQIGDLDIVGDLTISGRGTRLSIISGQHAQRVLDLQPGASLLLQDVTLVSGRTRGEGGANVRAQAGAAFEALRTRILDGQASFNSGVDGVGGGIVALSGATVAVRESELSRNIVSGDATAGGAIGCVDCASVELVSATVAGNEAEGLRGGGGVHIQGGASLLLEYATVTQNSGGGVNRERTGGIGTDGAVALTAAIVADNAFQDIVCTASQTLAGDQSLVEHVQGCVVPVAIATRGVALPADDARLLQTLGFLTDPDNAPSRVAVPLLAATAVLVDQIAPAALGCSGRVDQLGADRPAGGLCDLGALEVPNIVPSVYRLDLEEVDPLTSLPGTGSFELRLTNVRAATTTVTLSVNPGCAITPASVSIAAGDTTSAPIAVTAVDDALWDAAPSFAHECVISGTVTAGEAAMVGDGFGALRVIVRDDDSLVPVLVASPDVNGLVDFPVAAVRDGNRQFIRMTNTGRIPLQVTAGTLLGADAAHFQLNSVRFPFSVAAGASVDFPVDCVPTMAGDYAATLRLTTNDPFLPDKDWLLDCSGRYTVQVFDAVQLEDMGGMEFSIALNAPNMNGSLFAVVETRDGTALAGEDYQPLRYRVLFNSGEQYKTVVVPLKDDAVREADETLLLSIVEVSPLAKIMLDGPQVAAGTIEDNESRQGDLRVRIDSMPREVAEAAPFVVSLTLTNRSDLEASGISLVSTWRLGALYQSAELNGEPCDVSTDRKVIRCGVAELAPREQRRLRIEAKALRINDRLGAGGNVDARLAFAAQASEPEVRTNDNEVENNVRLLNSSDTGSGGGSWPLASLLLAGLLALRRRGSPVGQ